MIIEWTKMIYPCIFYKEGDSYWAEFPDLEGCQSIGDTPEEIYFNAKEALIGYISVLLEQGSVQAAILIAA